MANYFRWIKGSKKDEPLYQKPRSRSLDAKALELSGIKLLLHHVGTSSLLLLLIAAIATPNTSWTELLWHCLASFQALKYHGAKTQTPEFFVISIHMLCLHLAIVIASYVVPFRVLWSYLCPLIFHQLSDDER